MPDQMEAYDPECVKAVMAVEKNGHGLAVHRKDEDKRVVLQFDKNVAVLGVQCDWGFRVTTTRGKKLMSRKQALERGFKVLDAFFSTQFSKTLFGSSAMNTRGLGMKFEIVPLENPFAVSPGKVLQVAVIFDGKPLADAIVSSGDDAVPVKTDKDGIVGILFPENGAAILSARHKVPVKNNPDMDYHLYTAFLIAMEP
jgi:uncharacterized GH25 family protein